MKSGESNKDLYIEYLAGLLEKIDSISILIRQSKYEVKTLIKILKKYS